MSVDAPPSLELIEATHRDVERSPADVLRVVVALALTLVALLLEWLAGDALIDFASDLTQGLSAIPTWILDVVVVTTRVLAVILLVAGVVTVVRRGPMAPGAGRGPGRGRGGVAGLVARLRRGRLGAGRGGAARRRLAADPTGVPDRATASPPPPPRSPRQRRGSPARGDGWAGSWCSGWP